MSTAKTKLDTGLVRELAAILREADLGEVEIEHDGLRIRVSKPAAPVMQSAVMAAPVASAIKSPMVGTVYLSPEPGAKQFFNIGDKVKKGDTLMLVEAMKTFNPVEADRAGTLTALYVTDSQPVEFGEPLALIE